MDNGILLIKTKSINHSYPLHHQSPKKNKLKTKELFYGRYEQDKFSAACGK